MSIPSVPCPVLSGPITVPASPQPQKYRACPSLPFRQYWQGPEHMPAESGHAFVGAAAEGLAFYVYLEDSDIFSRADADNQKLWTLGDVAEFFVKPGRQRPDYWEVHLAPNGFVMDIYIPDRARFTNGEITWDQVIAPSSGVQSRVEVGKGHWAAEICIPWAAFGTTNRPEAGTLWQFAVCRYNYNGGLDNPEHSSTAHLSQTSFHHYEDFTDLVF